MNSTSCTAETNSEFETRFRFLAPLAVFLAAVLGRLPALGAWWSQDDWGLLGRAAGIVPESAGDIPARILSQKLWWSLTWPLFHLDPLPHAWCRLLLHGLSAVLVLRIGHRAGLKPLAGLTAGLLFAATPLAFTPLYWAAGIQEILAVVFALLAVERWLAGGRKNILWAVMAGTASLLAKESGLGLPLFFTIMLWTGSGIQLRDKAFAWAMCLLFLLVAVIEGVLVLNHFNTDPGDPYATGGLMVALANLGVFGWWLATPGPVFASKLGWPMATVGLLVFSLWAAWAIVLWRRGRRLAAAAFVAALLSLGPALPLQGQIHPYLAYLAAAAFSLALATILPRRWPLKAPILVMLSVLAIVWGFSGMRARLGARDPAGLPADPVVRTTSLSWQICRGLPDLPLNRSEEIRPSLTFLQIPVSARTAEMATRLGEQWVTGSSLYHALGGHVGPSLVLGSETRIDWVNALYSNPDEALVLCEFGTGFKHWGTTTNAALYAALTDIGLGHFDRARKHFIRAGDLGGDTFGFSWDPDQMIIPFEQVIARKKAFVSWTVSLLENGEASRQEVGGLQDLYFSLLSTCTGLSVEEITSDSELLKIEPK
ncbi:MAG: hypothetical protein KOO60_04065 [Gemmatimonadales bacterium]|nr:hypothetical protein [Gemmatimonadales bacterium]